MRLLVSSVCCPCPTDSGHKLRSWALLRALANLGHEVTLVVACGRNEHPDLNALRRLCASIYLVPCPAPALSSAEGAAGRLHALTSPFPYAVLRYRSAAVGAALQRACRSAPHDLLIADTPFALANLPPALAWAPPYCLFAHNVEHQLLERFVALHPNPIVRIYARLEAAKLRRWEQDAARGARQVWACSPVDAAAFRLLAPATPVAVAPNVVDLTAYVPRAGGEPHLLLFTGGMDWLPNRDALAWLGREIWPRIQAQRPGTRLLVAGRGGAPRLRQRLMRHPTIQFTGRVSDMRDLLAAATLCVVPLRIGSGTRFKILEAAAMAKPIVSTSLGAEGLNFAHGREILLADCPRAFADAVLLLLSDAKQGRRLGAAARRRAEHDHGLPALEASLAAALGEFRHVIHVSGAAVR